jgi:hypothetical protein
VRQDSQNPELKLGVVQLAKYLWKKDAAFSSIREAQRQFVLQDTGSALFSTLPYEVNDKDKIHLVTKSYVELGEQIAKSMIEWEKNGRFITPGPAPERIAFTDSSRKEVEVSFSNSAGLSGGENKDEWFITDTEHQGFGSSGFVLVASVKTHPDSGKVTLQLEASVGTAAALSYGYRADVGGTLRNGENHPAAAFVKLPVQYLNK